MGTFKKIKIKWEDYHDDILFSAAGTVEDLIYIKKEVNDVVSSSTLWFCEYENSRCYMVTRWDCINEVCIVLFSGENFIPLAKKIILDLKKNNNNTTIRAHVKRKGMIRLLKKIGFDISEIVMRV